MLRNFKLGTAIALFAWSEEATEIEQAIPYLSIARSDAGSRYAYSPPINKSTIKFETDTSREFVGPRTILTLLSTATASQGEILPIKTPYNHSSYNTQFYGPVVTCSDANSSTVPLIESFLQKHASEPLGTAYLNESAYYAFVPDGEHNGELTAMDGPRYQQPSNATNELWMTFWRYVANNDTERIRERRHQVCRLHNATYDLILSWDHGFQDVTSSYTHAYSAFMWTLTDQLVGSFAWYIESEPSSYRPAQFGRIDSPIQHNSLLGSSDLDVFFDFSTEKGLYLNDPDTEPHLSDQRTQDKALARNRTLDVLIEELSINITVSLLHNELLEYNRTGVVTMWEEVNRCGYMPNGLFIPYALANLFCLVTVVLGTVSYSHHGVLPDKKFQDIVSVAEDPQVGRLMREGGRQRSITGSCAGGVFALQVAEGNTK
ncbi:hypothetical protein VM1G_11206 [Cytospora mali]|uniref:Uncharacterized protein n=1 Tax=Cytospora mali TaxID=578113 RepID=A0A194VK92_CYTMA|nr:hypothetical protein VM1G_11206 [Valsa mali]